MKKSAKRVPPTGELRQSQLLTTFGPGAMVDLPEHAVLIGGLEHWRGERKRIYEERLEERVRELLDLEEVALYAPPVEDGTDLTGPRSGITAFQFPTWFLAQVEETYTAPDGRQYRTRPLVRWSQLRGGKHYFTEDRKKKPVVPVRFVQACVKGHISDVDWYAFVRRDFHADKIGQLWLDEGGAGNDFSEIYVRCERTGARRQLADATVIQAKALGPCSGRQPWLGPRVWETCKETARLLVRSASSAYFSRTESVIAIPDTDAAAREAVDRVYEDFLQYAESASDVRRERKKQKVFYALEGFADDAVWAEIERRKSGGAAAPKGIKQAEIETLLSSQTTLGEDAPDGDFYARARSLDGLPAGGLRDRLARALEAQKLELSLSSAQLDGQVPAELLEGVRAELQEMRSDGMAPRHLARLLRLLADERQAAQVIADRVELVWSGLDLETSTTRDTEVVVRQLFREARRSVLVASYAVDKGKKAESLFGHLAERMDREPDLEVRFFLNVHRKNHKDETPESVLLRQFADTFRDQIWPGERLPAVFHDPRSLAVGGATRACLHAKCIVVDEERALITSANFTAAAQERNIEAGVTIADGSLARALKAQFDTLVDRGALRRVPGL